MIFNITSGGGSAPLNFQIIGGTTEPINPSENMIWINTDVEITNWIFSHSEPENPIDNMIWIITSTTSTAKFNILKENGIIIYPLSAKQYINSEWVTVTAMSYQDQKWVDWILYLYNNGEEYFDEFGNGWTASGTYTKGENYLLAGRTENAGAYSGTWTSGFFDTTNLTTIEIYIDKYSRGGPESFGKILIIDELGNTLITKSYSASQTAIWESLDISAITSKKCRIQITSGHTRTAGQKAYIQFSIVRCY